MAGRGPRLSQGSRRPRGAGPRRPVVCERPVPGRRDGAADGHDAGRWRRGGARPMAALDRALGDGRAHRRQPGLLRTRPPPSRKLEDSGGEQSAALVRRRRPHDRPLRRGVCRGVEVPRAAGDGAFFIAGYLGLSRPKFLVGAAISTLRFPPSWPLDTRPPWECFVGPRCGGDKRCSHRNWPPPSR